MTFTSGRGKRRTGERAPSRRCVPAQNAYTPSGKSCNTDSRSPYLAKRRSRLLASLSFRISLRLDSSHSLSASSSVSGSLITLLLRTLKFGLLSTRRAVFVTLRSEFELVNYENAAGGMVLVLIP